MSDTGAADLPAVLAIDAGNSKTEAALVSPRTLFPAVMTRPAPMKPRPVRIPAIAWGDDRPATAVTAVAAPPIRMKVRSPAGEPRSWRSNPKTKATAHPMATRAKRCRSVWNTR